MKCQCAESYQCEMQPESGYHGPGVSLSREDVVDSLETIAQLLGSPEPLGLEEAEHVLNLLTNIPNSGLQVYAGDPARFQEAWNRQREMFTGLPGGLPLEESYYKEWTSDDAHPLAVQKRLTQGDSAAHMAVVLESFGIELSAEDPTSPDNLAVLLEFLAVLVENRTQEEVTAFCIDHLDWLPDLRREAEARGSKGAFHQLIGTVENLVRQIVSM